jgi:hypothetical protein
LLTRYIDGPGHEGRATTLHDREYPKSSGRDPPPREGEPICKVGFGRDHGGRYPDERWLCGPGTAVSSLLPLEGVTYGCKRLDTTDKAPRTGCFWTGAARELLTGAMALQQLPASQKMRIADANLSRARLLPIGMAA